MNSNNAIDILLWGWFALTFLSTIYVAYDLFARTPAMKIMKWGWIFVTLTSVLSGSSFIGSPAGSLRKRRTRNLSCPCGSNRSARLSIV